MGHWIYRKNTVSFSRCASKAASPTFGDVKALNKLARQLKAQPVKLQFWPLAGPLRIIGFPDASYRNDEDGSSQRGMKQNCVNDRQKTVCRMKVQLLTVRTRNSKIVLSSTVAEFSSMKCFGSCEFLRGFQMDTSGKVADIHMRTDAKNLETIARTIHLP